MASSQQLDDMEQLSAECNVKVVVRCRPMTKEEKAEKPVPVIKVAEERQEIHLRQMMAGKESSKVFTYDKTFNDNSSQRQIYETVVSPMVEEALLGFNCTVFAYGQTGTGKTYTMEGIRQDKDKMHLETSQEGVIPRAAHHIFEYLNNNSIGKAEYTVRVSFMELYNEELSDLLSAEKKPLRIFEDGAGKKGLQVHGLEEVVVNSAEDVFAILERGWQSRRTAETKMNKQSSRSHAIFTITVHIKEVTPDGEDLLKVGKLTLVDLAGSECVGRSGAVDKRAKEAGMINQSLLTLGRVITSLVEHHPHIPYRDSKLTRLLQESLGGRAKTCIIATVSPHNSSFDETQSTLDYAYRAKNIKNRPEVNQKMTKHAYLKDLNKEIERLSKQLQAQREKDGSVMLSFDDHENMIQTQERNKILIEELELSLETNKKDYDELQSQFSNKKKQLELEEAEHGTTKQVLITTENNLNITTATLKSKISEIEDDHVVISEYSQNEDVLYKKASNMIKQMKDSTNDILQLYNKIDRKTEVLNYNKRYVSQSQEILDTNVNSVINHNNDYISYNKDWYNNIAQNINQFLTLKNNDVVTMKSVITELASIVAVQSKTIIELQQSNSQGLSALTRSNTEQNQDQNKQLMSYLQSTNESIQHIALKLQQQINSENNLMNNFKSNMIQCLELNKQDYDIFSKDHVNHLSSLTTTTQKFNVSHIGNLQSHTTSLEQMLHYEKQQADLMQQNLLNSIEKIVKESLSEQRSSFEKRMQEMMSTVVSYTTAVGHQQDDFVGQSKQIIDNVHEYNMKHTQKIQNNIKDINMEYDSICAEEVAVSASVSEIQSACSSSTSQGVEMIHAYNDAHLLQASEMKNIIEKQHSNSINSINQFTDKVDETILNLNTNVESMDGHIQTQIVNVEAHIMAQHHHLLSYDSDQHSALSILSKNIDQLSSELKTDIPTGLTPMKKEYMFPSPLKMTAPRNAILSKYNRNGGTTVEIDAETIPQLKAAASVAVSESPVVEVMTTMVEMKEEVTSVLTSECAAPVSADEEKENTVTVDGSTDEMMMSVSGKDKEDRRPTRATRGGASKLRPVAAVNK